MDPETFYESLLKYILTKIQHLRFVGKNHQSSLEEKLIRPFNLLIFIFVLQIDSNYYLLIPALRYVLVFTPKEICKLFEGESPSWLTKVLYLSHSLLHRL